MASVYLIALVNIFGGLIFGFHIGIVGVYTEFSERNANCVRNLDEAACVNNKHVTCIWEPGSSSNNTNSSKYSIEAPNSSKAACLFEDHFDCKAIMDQNMCKSTGQCGWDFSTGNGGSCEHFYGWKAWQKGLFSGAMVIGAMFGSSFTGQLLDRFGRKCVILNIGINCFLGGLLMALATAMNSYGLLIFSRLFLGLGIGAVCVACPMYVSEMVEEKFKGPLGVAFQFGVTIGILLEALIAYVIEPKSAYGEQFWIARIQYGFILPTVVASFLLSVVAVIIPESDVWLRNNRKSASQALIQGEAGGFGQPGIKKPLLVAIVLCFGTQMTGMNAIMNYAPSITAAAGLDPLQGNFYVMVWNCFTSGLSIPFAQKFERRKIYLGTMVLGFFASLCAGVGSHPDWLPDDTRHILSAIGIAFFIMAFELGLGPMFFILATELFPPNFVQTGSSFTNAFNLLLNAILNFGFPVAVVALSGGVSEDQDLGTSSVFFIFAGIGFFSFLFLVRNLQPWTQDYYD